MVQHIVEAYERETEDGMALELDLQLTGDWPQLPAPEEFEAWLTSALQPGSNIELTIRLVDRDESRELNRTFRGKDSADQCAVISGGNPRGYRFAVARRYCDLRPAGGGRSGGAGQAAARHWAHLTIHGMFHLMGYDHQDDEKRKRWSRWKCRCSNHWVSTIHTAEWRWGEPTV